MARHRMLLLAPVDDMRAEGKVKPGELGGAHHGAIGIRRSIAPWRRRVTGL